MCIHPVFHALIHPCHRFTVLPRVLTPSAYVKISIYSAYGNSEYPKVYVVTKVRSYRLQVLGYRVQVLGYRAQVPGRCWSQVLGRQAAGAGQVLGRCWAGAGQVLGTQVAGAGQTGCRCRAGAGQVLGRCWAGTAGCRCRAGAGQVLQVPGRQVSGLAHRPRGPGY